MSGEINVETNGLFGDEEPVLLTRSRLNQLVTGLVMRIAANAITSREIADGSVSLAKLSGLSISTAMLEDLAVTAPKIGAGAITREKLSSLVLPQISEVSNTEEQTLTAGVQYADVNNLSVSFTPMSANSKFLVICKLCASCSSGGKLSAGVVVGSSLNPPTVISRISIAASSDGTLTFFNLYIPQTGSAVSYKVQAAATTNNIVLAAGESSLVVQEII